MAKLYCPYCEGNLVQKSETDTRTFRKEKLEVVHHFLQCNKCPERFTTTELDQQNWYEVNNAYKKKQTSIS